jgi:hypothetical protein
MSSMAVGPFPMRLLLRKEDAQHIHLVFFLDIFLPIFGLRFAIDCPSHVRPLRPFTHRQFA